MTQKKVHDGLVGKSTATDEYPTEQQGISNFLVVLLDIRRICPSP
jgi:hypothetical protein